MFLWSICFFPVLLFSLLFGSVCLNTRINQIMCIVLLTILYDYVCWYSSVSLSVHPSVCPSVHPSVCTSVYPSVCLYVRQSVCLSVHLSVWPSVCPSVSLYICPSVSLYVRPSVCQSVCPSVNFTGTWASISDSPYIMIIYTHNCLTPLKYLNCLYYVLIYLHWQTLFRGYTYKKLFIYIKD